LESNLLAWRIYTILDGRDRPINLSGAVPIPSTAILHLCEAYDATMEDFEKVLFLDGLLYKPSSEADKEPPKPKVPRKRSKRQCQA